MTPNLTAELGFRYEWNGSPVEGKNRLVNFDVATSSLVQVGTVQAWMVVIVIGREFAVTGLRSVSAAQGLVIEASDLGKYKTVAQYLAVSLLILERSVPVGFDSEFVYVSRGMLWAALTLTVFSGIDYFVRFYRASDVESLVRGEDRWR